MPIGSRLLIQRDDLAQPLGRVGSLALLADAQLRLLLRERERMDERLLDRHRRRASAIRRKAAEAFDVVDQLLVRHVLPREHRPPPRLRRATVEIQQVEDERAQLLVVGPRGSDRPAGRRAAPRDGARARPRSLASFRIERSRPCIVAAHVGRRTTAAPPAAAPAANRAAGASNGSRPRCTRGSSRVPHRRCVTRQRS